MKIAILHVKKGTFFALNVLFLCYFFIFQASATIAQNQDAPALWKIETRNSTTYFLGSFHLLKEGTNWMDDRIAMAFEESIDLTLEIDPTQMNQRLVAFLIQQNGLLSDIDKLQNMVDPKIWQQFVALCNMMGLPIQNMQRMRPWYAATILSVQYAQTQGFDQNLGVDNVLSRKAVERGIKQYGLELASDQIMAFSKLKNSTQIEMLEDSVKNLSEMPVLYKELLEAWKSGDEEELERVLIEDMAEVEDLYSALMIRRNRNWVPKLIKRMSQSGTHFVVVGTSHLVGEDSVLNMLRAQGYVPERVY